MVMRTWHDLSLRAKCLLLISIPAAATVLMFGVANVLAARSSASVAMADRARQTGEQIQRLRTAETQLSADVRAYFITSEETFASQAGSSIVAIDSARQQLFNLLTDPARRQTLSRIASIEHAREERVFGGVARFRAHAFPLDQLRSALHDVEGQRHAIDDSLKTMENDNTRQLEAALRRVEALRSRQAYMTAICLFWGLLAGLAMTALFAHGITRRLNQLRRNLERAASGSPLEDLPGRDEIGALNQGLARLGEVLRRRRVVLENALHGIAEIDPQGRYVWLNQAYADMTGSSPNHRPASLTSTLQAEDQPRVAEAITQMRAYGRAEIAARIQPVSRSPIFEVGLTLLAPAEDPNSDFYVFLRDLWAGKRGDAALIRAKDAAVDSNRAKTEFLAKISHDIRTPLNAILGSADLLSQTSLNPDQAEYVSMFQRNCRRLVALINDFLDFSRIEAGAVHIEIAPFRIRETVEDAVATFREAAARKGIVLAVEIDPAAPQCALGDCLRIGQVLVNLLSNALKFTSAGRIDVNVKVTSAASAADKLRFEVCDTGAGIALEHQDKIFARFVQLPNQSAGQRGAGLGLTICRDLVALMEGEIGVVSREGQGSTFHFSLPLEAVQPALADLGPAGLHQAGSLQSKIDPAKLAGGQPVRLLVAEDTEDNRLLLEHFLRDQPVKVRFVENGREAVDAIEQGEQFDLILMDIDMPVMDGYIATQRIRAWQHSTALPTPIVALSADAMQEAVRASMEAGCVAHVAKPIDRETLLKTIRRYAPGNGAQNAAGARPIAVSEQVMALVPQYLASKEKQIEDAREALAARDFGTIRRFGHNLKGTGRGYGFPPIEDLGREIERAAAQADPNRIAEQLDALHRFVSESAAILAGS
jgi:signal transduction histidine kinase/CheY-like chemotaxis protein/HPt (histidine-containing phosphotransfer) domain-containing protein/CHASE3 domain sensor protein